MKMKKLQFYLENRKMLWMSKAEENHSNLLNTLISNQWASFCVQKVITEPNPAKLKNN